LPELRHRDIAVAQFSRLSRGEDHLFGPFGVSVVRMTEAPNGSTDLGYFMVKFRAAAGPS
jgi:hypothetical protein